MGLFLYDVPFRTALRKGLDILWMILIGAFSLIDIFLDASLIIPFAIFLFVYIARLFLVQRKIPQLGNGLGMLGYSFLFVLAFGRMNAGGLLLVASLFVFMLGSEFTVMSVIKRRRVLLIYNIVPPFLFFLNPLFGILAISLGRIPVALVARKVRIVGIVETLFLLVVVVVLEYFYVLRF
jgi:hypothetical protein